MLHGDISQHGRMTERGPYDMKPIVRYHLPITQMIPGGGGGGTRLHGHYEKTTRIPDLTTSVFQMLPEFPRIRAK